MPRRSRISILRNEIIKNLKVLKKDIYSYKDLEELFHRKEKIWKLPIKMDEDGFSKALIREEIINCGILDFGRDYYDFLYISEVPIFLLVISIIPKSYLSHNTALRLWGLAENQNNIVVVNQEQNKSIKKYNNSNLVQEKIDEAFLKPSRQSKSISKWKGYDIMLVNGKFTNSLGVISKEIEQIGILYLTDLERTLIDCVVRPAYAGNAIGVLSAFKHAKDKGVDINKLGQYLNSLDYTYPYHQAVGFYMEKSGNYDDKELDVFRKKKIEYKFYLENEISDIVYSDDWKIYYPRELK